MGRTLWHWCGVGRWPRDHVGWLDPSLGGRAGGGGQVAGQVEEGTLGVILKAGATVGQA